MGEVAVGALGVVVAAVVATLGYLFNQRQARNERLAALFAQALRVVGEYRGIAFEIRRRSAADATTRTKYADRLAATHAALDFYIYFVALEAPSVGKPYESLVDVLRDEVGPHIKNAWTHAPVATDDGMNMGLGQEYPSPRTHEAIKKCMAAMGSELRTLRWR
jgi:hypothetical protein